MIIIILLTTVLFIIVLVNYNYRNYPISTSVAFHVKTSHFICTANQLTGFCMKWNTGLKWVTLDLSWFCKIYGNGYKYFIYFCNSFVPIHRQCLRKCYESFLLALTTFYEVLQMRVVKNVDVKHTLFFGTCFE